MIPVHDEPTVGSLSCAVVICAYTEDRWHDIQLAIESVLLQQYPPDEIILVIDHNPALFSRASQAYPAITVVANGGPKGLSGARNEGYRRSSGEIVAFLDDDARAQPGWLAQLLEAYGDGEVMGGGGAVVPGWSEPRPRWLPPEFDWVIGCSHSGMPAAPAAVRNLVGANMSFRRTSLDLVGGFSTSLGRTGANGAGCEETEMCIRASQAVAGGRLVYDPSALVTHTVSPDRRTPAYFLRRCYAEGRSKALVRSMVGTAALYNERRDLRDTIPAGVRQALSDAVGGDIGALGRAASLVGGVAVTCLGYGSARLRSGTGSRRRVPAAPPVTKAALAPLR